LTHSGSGLKVDAVAGEGDEQLDWPEKVKRYCQKLQREKFFGEFRVIVQAGKLQMVKPTPTILPHEL
jgi:hypothetical protein